MYCVVCSQITELGLPRQMNRVVRNIQIWKCLQKREFQLEKSQAFGLESYVMTLFLGIRMPPQKIRQIWRKQN